RHMVDAVGRYVVDDDAAGLDLLEGCQRVLEIVGEDPGLESEVGIVDLVDACSKALHRRHGDDRRERFLGADAAGQRSILDDGWLEERAAALAAGEDRRAVLRGFLDPLLGPRRLLLVDHRAHFGVLAEWITNFEGGDGLDEFVADFLVAVLMDQYALDGDTCLPGVGESSGAD